MVRKKRDGVFLLLIVFVAYSMILSTRKVNGADSSLFVKKAGWGESMIATRDKMAGKIAVTPVELGPWYKTKALPTKNISTPAFPEKKVDLKAKSKNGKRIWKKQRNYGDGVVHKMTAGSNHSTYLFREISTPKAASLGVSLGSDDGLKLFLNGKTILTRDVARGVSAGQDTAVLNLKPGKNELLLKIYNRSGDHGFYFSLLNNPLQVLWTQFKVNWPTETSGMEEDSGGSYMSWFSKKNSIEIEKKMIKKALKDLGGAGTKIKKQFNLLCRNKAPSSDPAWLDLYAKAAGLRERQRLFLKQVGLVNLPALRRAVEDLSENYPKRYTRGKEFLKKIGSFESRIANIKENAAGFSKDVEEIIKLQREALLSNPLLDFDRLLLVKRKSNRLGLPQNWQGDCALPRSGYDNEIAILSPVSPDGKLTTFFKPAKGEFVGDVDLNFDADKMLFSMNDDHGRWQIWELKADGTGLRQVTSCPENDIDNYDPCYLPNGKIIFGSTGCFQGIPCVGGSNAVANLFLINPDGTGMRQLCFDQDHDWCPVVLNSGRILYTRWEYSDTPHYFSRLLFKMNPDGTDQKEFYGSNSFWPNSTFYARPIPNEPTEVVAIVSGHHGAARMGELILFDPAKGRHEADGVVQRIPGYGKKVEPLIRDQLVRSSWPKFLHPYPLSNKYFLVSCKPTASSLWGLYLVDIFDNILLLKELPDYALFEPVPFRKTVKPPVIPEKVDLTKDYATVYLTDIYAGNGLKGVPRGTVKNLRLYEFYYAYPKMGGHKCIGVEGSWDVHRILGTVPVYRDGSAKFTVPADMPIAVQPLDSSGMSLQLMRSWFTAMPGESLSCVGCHERQNYTTPVQKTTAFGKRPSRIKSWYGPARGFSFRREVQPVLDKYCVGCHDGKKTTGGKTMLDLTDKPRNGWGNFTPSYLNLHPYVRRPGPESDYHLQKPLEFCANTSKLIQMLKKGHYNVKLDKEAWDRLVTWIDLNVPDHGTWGEYRKIPSNFHKRRLEMRTNYAFRPEDPEKVPQLTEWLKPVKFVNPKPVSEPKAADLECPGFPFDGKKAKTLQQAAASGRWKKTIDLGDGVTMDIVLIPAGKFIMGSMNGSVDEHPLSVVTIRKPFWMSVKEVSWEQYNLFNPAHDNGYFDQHHKDHTTPGYRAQAPEDPVIRVSWNEAVAFTAWLSKKTGMEFTLPTEAQWEWACRAGTDTPFYYGGLNDDFSGFENLADQSIGLLAVSGVNPHPIRNPNPHEDFLPKDSRFNDGQKLMAPAGTFKPNQWGLKDMHGNVAEWTRTTYRPYPYQDNDGRNDLSTKGDKVVRGGSWFDRPMRATSSFRLSYRPFQPVFNVGIRVIAKEKK